MRRRSRRWRTRCKTHAHEIERLSLIPALRRTKIPCSKHARPIGSPGEE